MEELNKHYSINHQRTPRNLDEFKQMKQKHLMTTITTSNIHATYALRSRKKKWTFRRSKREQKRKSRCTEEGVKEKKKMLAAKRYLFDAELTIESAKFNVLLMFILLN